MIGKGCRLFLLLFWIHQRSDAFVPPIHINRQPTTSWRTGTTISSRSDTVFSTSLLTLTSLADTEPKVSRQPPRWKIWKRWGPRRAEHNDHEKKTTTSTSLRQQPRRSSRRMLQLGATFLVALLARPVVALAGGGGMGGGIKASVAPMERQQLVTLSALWLGLFTILALLHAVEIAITTLYPWKVREIAEEEEKQGKSRSVFKILNQDITRVLTTILVTSTACSIFATTLFTHLVASAFGTRGERWGAIALTALTLFFVELLPKSLGVVNAEKVARIMVPPINIVSAIVSPLGISLSWLSKKTLHMLGVRAKDGGDGVSDSQLRLIVTGALDSGTIDHGEQEMIQGVLNLQDQRVKEVMRPRVDIIAVPKEMSVVNVLGVVREFGYSRIPVYDGEIDNIVGIVLAKNVLDFFVNGVLIDEDLAKKITRQSMDDVAATKNGGKEEEEEEEESTTASTPATKVDSTLIDTLAKIDKKNSGDKAESYVRTLTATELASRMEKSIEEADLIEECYFVPETANGWSVLQEMRKRRVHVAIVVDEYGGTEGLVSLEDIVEEVVGEIYDEDDEELFEFSEDSITLQEDGSFVIRGDADLDDVDTILGLKLSDEEEDALKEFSTLSGFLCWCAGEIPSVGDFIMSRGWSFDIVNADDKRILQVKVERLVGGFEEKTEDEGSDNLLTNLFKRTMNDGSSGDGDAPAMEAAAQEAAEELTVENKEEARELERMVDASNRKKELLEAVRAEEANRDSES